MSEIIERVAKAIAENQHLSWLYDEKTCAMSDPKKLDTIREDLRKAASAAIEAMREPTEQMLTSMEPWTKVSGHQKLVWTAGIDEALK